MADIIKQVTTVDIQLLDASRGGTTTVKLDNPKQNITREQVSGAMQTAINNGWLLTNKGDVVTYLGDITISDSIKRILGGEDYYITPNRLDYTSVGGGSSETKTLTVSGAIIQGVSIDRGNLPNNVIILNPVVSANGLSVDITLTTDGSGVSGSYSFTTRLVILGQTTEIPCTLTR